MLLAVPSQSAPVSFVTHVRAVEAGYPPPGAPGLGAAFPTQYCFQWQLTVKSGTEPLRHFCAPQNHHGVDMTQENDLQLQLLLQRCTRFKLLGKKNEEKPNQQ